MNSYEARSRLVENLKLDLIGPSPEDSPELQAETLNELPHQFYLGGFLMPVDADEVVEEDEEAGANEADEAGSDNGGRAEAPTARPVRLQSSFGLSVLVPAASKQIELEFYWGEYAEKADRRGHWKRTPRRTTAMVDLSKQGTPVELPDSKLKGAQGGLYLEYVVREASEADFGVELPKGTRSVSVFVVNRRRGESVISLCAFQAEMRLKCAEGFTPRPDLRGLVADDTRDEDMQVADLHYRDTKEYVVGHATSGLAIEVGSKCAEVRTVWIPTAEVERVSPREFEGAGREMFDMESLAALKDGDEAVARLSGLVSAYAEWIKGQEDEANALDSKGRKQAAAELIGNAKYALSRIEKGIKLLKEDPQALDAFKVANAAMANSNRHRSVIAKGYPLEPEKANKPYWRPFQLAFVLQALRGIANPTENERREVDLLFFPTGGGKTEAYLGLAAFTLVLRRLQNPGTADQPAYAGVSVLMRYTLRLLTIDQLGRAAGLICALEIERKKRTDLGQLPFEVGLWVGSAATPNRLGDAQHRGKGTAIFKVEKFRRDWRPGEVANRPDSPIPLEACPWCGSPFTNHSFHLVPSHARPTNLVVTCANEKCQFSDTDKSPLPIVGVDEPLYRRLPCFVIATIDKFASLPWTGEVSGLFGKVSKYANNEFFGAGSVVDGGKALNAPLLPPDLIIQDELHLISGPLGTIAGLYESAIERLCEREVTKPDGTKVAVFPKIIASTATVRRAKPQIRALFGRTASNIFPPPGVSIKDSFFAVTEQGNRENARLYAGVSVQGRNQKVVMMRVSNALLASALKLYEVTPLKLDPATKPKEKAENEARYKHPADPYMTLLTYFNSLKELGGSRRIFEDEVFARIKLYGDRDREEPRLKMFSSRSLSEVVELTSRVSTSKVADAKRQLGKPYGDESSIGVALATNMISVGLDITRLGMMLVSGQPKTSAEYIQATSRVGRENGKPGLVVTILNAQRPRDRSHYERFANFHATFYRSVEASSVTPYSPRALDRALAAALVGLVRHGIKEMTPSMGAVGLPAHRELANKLVESIALRAAEHSHSMTQEEREKLRDHLHYLVTNLLDCWHKVIKEAQDKGDSLKYGTEAGNAQRLLYDFLDREVATLTAEKRRFRSNRSMRDVERVALVEAVEPNQL